MKTNCKKVLRAIDEAFEDSNIVILDGMMVLDGLLGIYDSFPMELSFKNIDNINRAIKMYVVNVFNSIYGLSSPFMVVRTLKIANV